MSVTGSALEKSGPLTATWTESLRTPGLYVLGLTWQHTRTSALLGWVTNDAEFLADHIGSRSTSTELLAGVRG
jgi:hypothetical protein